MFKCSFMNYYCVKRLLKKGYSCHDFVMWYVDTDGLIYMYPIGYVRGDVIPLGNGVSMIFLGYSRRRRVL